MGSFICAVYKELASVFLARAGNRDSRAIFKFTATLTVSKLSALSMTNSVVCRSYLLCETNKKYFFTEIYRNERELAKTQIV